MNELTPDEHRIVVDAIHDSATVIHKGQRMNERIQELAERAGFMFWENEPWKPHGAVIDWSAQYDAELEKLIELIIQECIDVVEDEDDGSVDTRPVRWAVIRIKKHFGIQK